MLHFLTAYTGKKPTDPNPIGRELPKTDIFVFFNMHKSLK